MSAQRVHADDTTVPVLDAARGKTKTGRLWGCTRDDQPFGGQAPPAVLYCYSPDRKGDHPRAHLAGFRGIALGDSLSSAEVGEMLLPSQGLSWLPMPPRSARNVSMILTSSNGSATHAVTKMDLAASCRGVPGVLRTAASVPLFCDSAVDAWLPRSGRRHSGGPGP